MGDRCLTHFETAQFSIRPPISSGIFPYAVKPIFLVQLPDDYIAFAERGLLPTTGGIFIAPQKIIGTRCRPAHARPAADLDPPGSRSNLECRRTQVQGFNQFHRRRIRTAESVEGA
jgi:hypothetical protein